LKTYRPLRIFIASPGDLNEERNIFVDVLSEVNTIKAHSYGYHLEPIGWEETLPGIGRPQALINEELITCDLFIMLLWERWGTESGKYSSGTEEEYNVALEQNEKLKKPDIWLFFKNIVSEPNHDIDKILEFRRKIEEEKSIFYKPFRDISQWRSLLRKLMCAWLDKLKSREDASIEKMEVVSKDVSQVLVEVTYQDWIDSGLRLKPEIYFTILDTVSFENWKEYSDNDKRLFIYNQLSEHLYLTLGTPLYSGVLRYKMQDGRCILLGTIVFKYGDSIEDSRIYIPNNYNQIVIESKQETKLMDFWGRA